MRCHMTAANVLEQCYNVAKIHKIHVKLQYSCNEADTMICLIQAAVTGPDHTLTQIQ